MARRKSRGRKSYGYRYGKNFIRRSDYRKRAYEKYKNTYQRKADEYGEGMSPMLSYEDFIDLQKDYFINSGKTRSIGFIVNRQILITNKESVAGKQNFNKNIGDLVEKYNKNPNELQTSEIDLLNFMIEKGYLKSKNVDGKILLNKRIFNISTKDFRSNSAKWNELYSFMEEQGMEDQIIGS